MQGLVFWLTYPFLYAISLLPFPLFYRFSDFIFFLVYYVIRYRRKTVTENLNLVFPNKTDAEIRKIRKNFYQHICDMFLEMIKSISISEAELKKRFIFKNTDELRRLEKKNKSILLMCGHYASYEWLIALQLYGLKYESYGIYKKIKNKHFDKLVKKIRNRFAGIMIPTTEATEKIRFNQEKGILGNYAMVADQSPKLSRSNHWINFMGIRVPVFIGTEKLARKLDMAVIYLEVEKVSRGHYEATLIPISENPEKDPEHFITKKFIQLLEGQIQKNPQYYLWTHKRWKHRNQPIPKNATIIN